MAYHLLTINGRKVTVARGGQPVPQGVRAMVITGAHLDADEAALLSDWVEGGGRLVWHGPTWSHWGMDAAGLLGARPADFRLQVPAEVRVFGRSWRFEHHMTPEDSRLELAPCGAQPVACDANGFPMVWRHDLGAGRVIFALPVVEEAVLGLQRDPATRDAWADWYTGILAAVEGD